MCLRLILLFRVSLMKRRQNKKRCSISTRSQAASARSAKIISSARGVKDLRSFQTGIVAATRLTCVRLASVSRSAGYSRDTRRILVPGKHSLVPRKISFTREVLPMVHPRDHPIASRSLAETRRNSPKLADRTVQAHASSDTFS